MALPNLPSRGQNPWYDERTAWDTAVDQTLTNLSTGKANTVHTHVASDVTNFNASVDARVNSLVPAATTTTAGKVRLSTDAEAIAGLESTRALPPSALTAALNILSTSGRGLLAGDNGRSYRVVSCAIRNTGSGWATISDSGHAPIGVTGVSADSTAITISHNIGATKVVGSAISADDGLAGLIHPGASVGLSNSYITLRKLDHMADYITYNGTSWVSTRGLMTVSGFSGGVATISHDNVFTDAVGGANMVVNVTGRAGGSAAYHYGIASGGFGNTSVSVEVRNFSGALVTTPDANMRFTVDRGGYWRVVDPAAVTTTSYPGSNIWYTAILEV